MVDEGKQLTDTLSIIFGSTRTGRVGRPVAEWAHQQAIAHGKFAVDFIDLAELGLPLLDEPNHPRLKQYQHEHTRRWSARVAAADAFLFVTPEYDYFPSAALVNALQYLSQEWHYKAAAVLSYGGVSGGLRATQELRLLIANLNMMPITQSVPVPFFARSITEDKVFAPADIVADGFRLVLDELAKWSGALKPLRAG